MQVWNDAEPNVPKHEGQPKSIQYFEGALSKVLRILAKYPAVVFQPGCTYPTVELPHSVDLMRSLEEPFALPSVSVKSNDVLPRFAIVESHRVGLIFIWVLELT